jgi:rhodanese-related sulfurtransferase
MKDEGTRARASRWVEKRLGTNGWEWTVNLLGPDEHGQPDSQNFVVLYRTSHRSSKAAAVFADSLIDVLAGVLAAELDATRTPEPER